jgi:hypothetical protein
MIKVATSKNGIAVYVDTEKGHAATHIADDATLLGLVKEVIATIDLRGAELKQEYVFDHVVGECDLQTVDEDDDIVYARRLQRDRYTKFVKGKPRHQCSSVTIILKQASDGYKLLSAWVGHLVPSFPKLHATADQGIEEKKYWTTHALVWGKQAVDEATITTVCPWDWERVQ